MEGRSIPNGTEIIKDFYTELWDVLPCRWPQGMNLFSYCRYSCSGYRYGNEKIKVYLTVISNYFPAVYQESGSSSR